ncbi:hypothetical protein [Gemella sp. zg-1178]|uniref:hypothetical protein n=1 Tax=Gemella sp. zg-1178 TaxID=2840372 RepID=UPI001C048CF7|nr:hypothetical protein [Gemella sp. zg-1178]MBU0278685.1 hypothetical protein [Gemella sp. zg-1178]
MKNRNIYFIISLLEIFLTFAILIWNNLKDAKMGIVRHITFWNNYKFNSIFTSNIELIILIFITLFFIYHGISFIKFNMLGKLEIIFTCVALILY